MSEAAKSGKATASGSTTDRAIEPEQGNGLAENPNELLSLVLREAVAEPEVVHAPHDALPLRPAWRERLTTIVAISGGGFLGANARYLVGLWAAERFGAAFPWGTLLINVTGSFVLGFYLTLVTERFTGRATTRLFLATGFLGAYTTFSTLSYEAVQLLLGGATVPGLAYVVGSIALGLAAAIVGIVCAHAL
jgi:CrcB protein